jgi:putative FmdB family regulatory protein
MPTYQYACTECDHRFELVQSFTDAPASVCPACGSPVRKVFSSVGVVFKGSGFYRNDSRESAKSTSTSAKSDSGKSESKSEAKSDSGKSSDAGSSSSSSSSDSSSSSSSSSTSSSGSGSGTAAKSTASTGS